MTERIAKRRDNSAPPLRREIRCVCPAIDSVRDLPRILSPNMEGSVRDRGGIGAPTPAGYAGFRVRYRLPSLGLKCIASAGFLTKLHADVDARWLTPPTQTPPGPPPRPCRAQC